jgi:Na+/proline symporter
VLGIAGFILGPMLGVFLVGMFTRRRGSDAGNVLAITLGLASTVVLGGLHLDLANLVAPAFGSPANFVRPRWLPEVSFTWFGLVGSAVVFVVGILFRTPAAVLDAARQKAIQAQTGEDKPMALRGNEPVEPSVGGFEVANRRRH